MPMHVARAVPELHHHRSMLGFDAPLALVPTMGALHDGHLSLVRLAREHVGAAGGGGHVAVSVFINPTQFNDSSDFAAYPRTLDDDLRQLEAAGADMVFAPFDDEMYPINELPITVDVPSLTRQLEGAHRPGHFNGVCNVVLKLLNLVRPDAAVFGMKDFQQLRVIESMAQGLDVPTWIVRAPTLRDADGLAMSSRNRRLSPGERERALCIPRALEAARRAVDAGRTDAAEIVADATRALNAGGPAEVPLTVDYVAAVDVTRLEPVKAITAPTLLAIAAHVGPVRLIDNLVLG